MWQTYHLKSFRAPLNQDGNLLELSALPLLLSVVDSGSCTAL